MRAMVTFLLVLFSAISALAQQNHFVYIQADNRQPFYVKLGNKVYSSSYSGYIILSKLKEGDTSLTVGFPKNEFPEQQFNISIGKSDLGFGLKNFAEKGWGLFNLQSLNTIYAGARPATTSNNKTTEKKADAFSDMLSQVTGDSSLKESLVKEEKPQPVQKITDTVVRKVVSEDPRPKVEEKPIVKAEIPVRKTAITKAAEFVNEEAYSAIYLVDKGSEVKDTVYISIPLEKAEINQEKKEKPVTDVKFLDIEVDPSKKENIKTVTADTVKNEVKEIRPVADSTKLKASLQPVLVSTKQLNADCGSVATEDDFKKLRKKMAAQSNDDAMIYEARKAFRMKCYTTEQVKNLGSLFLTDVSKYSFYDAAYSRVSDPGNFESLVSELKEEYYINRFKAMLRK